MGSLPSIAIVSTDRSRRRAFERGLGEAPPGLAERLALREAEGSRGRHPVHQWASRSDGATETEPGTGRLRELRTVFRLECVGTLATERAEVGRGLQFPCPRVDRV